MTNEQNTPAVEEELAAIGSSMEKVREKGVKLDDLAEAGVPLEVAKVISTDRDIAVGVGEKLVEVKNLTMKFGGLTALDDVSFDIHRGCLL